MVLYERFYLNFLDVTFLNPASHVCMYVCVMYMNHVLSTKRMRKLITSPNTVHTHTRKNRL